MQKSRPKIDSFFTGGFHSDNESQFQPPNSYRHAKNIRLIFNDGGGLALQNDKGNLLSFTLKEYNGDILTDYVPIGSAVFSDKAVIFSTNGENSEIGFVTVDPDGLGTYTQVFNDKYDPNSALLNFGTRHNIEAHPVKENTTTENVYWTDGFNQFKCINILRGADFSYTPTFGVYPYYYSVHSLSVYCDWNMGRIKYKERIDGKLKTGVYQYTYRQGTRDGYRTPWYPITRHFISNSSPVTDSPYQMQPSNQVTQYGFRLEIDGLDTRFPIIEVAYIYSITENDTVDAGIFYFDDSDTRPAGTLTVDHITHAGDPINIEEFGLKYFPLRVVETLEEKDNYLFLGNVKEVGVLEPDVSEAVISPKIKLMGSDYGGISSDVFPLIQEQLFTTTTEITAYSGTDISYEINNEFVNYKGTQWEHLFTSYWRGETYRFGVLLFDRKGMPNYVFYIDDYTFPEQYDASGNYTLTEEDAFGNWKIRIMGAIFDGIRIPQEVLYDSDGLLNISAFSIVRAKRAPETLFQGVLMDTVYENNDTVEGSTARYLYTRPVPMTENYFPTIETAPVAGSYPNNARVLSGTKARGNSDFCNRAGTFLLHSPEILFGYTPTPTWTENSNLKVVAIAKTAEGHEQNQPGYNKIFFTQDEICHYFSKNYEIENTWSSQNGYALGDISYIEENGIYKTPLGDGDDFHITAYDNQRADLIYTQFGAVDFASSGADCTDCNVDKYSWGQPATLLLVTKDLKDVSAGTDARRNKVAIANFRKPSDSYFAGLDENALEKTLYISTGHFQPINAKVIGDTVQPDGSLLFNGIEVWGGDCYPYLFDYTRLLPQYRDCDTSGTDCYLDYSVSMIVPLESNINFSMRNGRQFAYAGVEPENTSCGANSTFPDGIQEKQREDFNINSVLQHEENVQFFNAKPTDIVNRKENPLTIIHSQLKYYGEPTDNYRRYLANNFIDLTGVNGDITKLFAQYSYIYFLQERGFGRLYINQPATLSSPEQGNIIVGSAGILTGALYISQEVGCQHQFSVTSGNNQTYWVDANLGKIYRFSQNGLQCLSDEKGQHNRIFNACKYYKGFDNPSGLGGIHGIYDYKNNEVLLTFLRSSRDEIPADAEFTISYSENTGAFMTLYSFLPKFYFELQGNYFSSNPSVNEDLYVHLKGNIGEYYGVFANSELQVISNTDLDIQKIYDITMLSINADGVSVLTQDDISTDVNSVTLSLLTDGRPRYKHGFYQYPLRGLSQTDRIRGKYVSQFFTIVNDGTLFRMTTMEVKFRPAYNN